MADVKINLPTIDGIIKTLQDSGELSAMLAGVGQTISAQIKKQWLVGTGADTTVFKAGNPQYLLKKGLSGRKPQIDMYYTGAMSKSFGVKKTSKDSATLGFSGDEIPKARSNQHRRPNMLDVDNPEIQKLATDNFLKLFRRKVKF